MRKVYAGTWTQQPGEQSAPPVEAGLPRQFGGSAYYMEPKTTFISRSGRVVDGTSPENWRRATVRGFKSYLRRQRRQALSYCRVVTSNGLSLSGVGGQPPTRLMRP